MSLFPYGGTLWMECGMGEGPGGEAGCLRSMESLGTRTRSAPRLQLHEPPENAMRPVGGVRPYRGRPRPLFRFCQPSCAVGHVRRVNVVHGGVPRHPRGVGRLEPIAGTAMDAGC